jgi:hypothetical protein
MENGLGETHIDAFNSGCDLVLSNIQEFIGKLDASSEGDAEKYDKVKRMVAGMAAVVASRRAPREESNIILPNQ